MVGTMDPAFRTSSPRVAQQRLRFEALRRRVFDDLEMGSARWRLTWMLPFQLSTVALLIIRGESHGRAIAQVLTVAVVAVLGLAVSVRAFRSDISRITSPII